MHRKFLSGVAIAMALVAISSKAAPAPADIAGYWVTAERDSIVQIGRCGSSICGIVRSYRGTPNETDRANRNAALRTRPICGLRIVGSVVPSGLGWTPGWLYNPETGSQYSLAIKSVSTQQLRMRVYEGVEQLGEDVVWTRSLKIPTNCSDV